MSAYWISAPCPACGWSGVLFVAEGGYLTCSRIGCPDPEAAHTVLEQSAPEVVPPARAEA